MGMDENEEQWEYGWLICSECGFAPAPTDVNVNEKYYCQQPKHATPIGEKCGGLMEFKPLARA